MKNIVLFLALLLASTQYVSASMSQFVDVTKQAGFEYVHGITPLTIGNFAELDKFVFAGGVAAGDYDNDGWVDLYVIRGSIGSNLLFRNLGNGAFEEVGSRAGLVTPKGAISSGSIFADFTGDGHLDLFVGGVGKTTPQLFRNRGDGTFENITPE